MPEPGRYLVRSVDDPTNYAVVHLDTPRRSSVIAFIADYWSRYGYSPTLREIAAGVALRSSSSVARIVDALIADGVLERAEKPGTHRSVRVARLEGVEG